MKVVTYRFVGAIRGLGARVFRMTPLVGSALRLPRGRVSSLERWVSDFRRAQPWDSRRTGPHYRKVRRALRAPASAPPRSAVNDDVESGRWVRPYEVHPELFVASIPNARLLGPNGVVITPDNRIADESAWIGEGWLEHESAVRALRLPKPEPLAGHYFTIASFGSEGYAHWILDALPRLSLLRYATPEARVVVSHLTTAWQRDSLTHLGLNPDELLVLGDRHVAVEFLHVPSYIGQPGRIHPFAVSWLRRKFLGARHVPEPGRRLYLTRGGGRRRVINEAELEPILRRFNFEVIDAGRFSLREQVELFGRAEAIAGPHGAALTNCVFAPEGCKVLELFAPTCVRPMYYQLTTVVGQPYWYLAGGENPDAREADRGFDNMWIRPEEFERTLADMFGR